MTQNDMILKHLKRSKYITTLMAINKYGITNLPKRICELTNNGHRFGRELRPVMNRYGKRCHVNFYWMEG